MTVVPHTTASQLGCCCMLPFDILIAALILERTRSRTIEADRRRPKTGHYLISARRSID